MSDVRLHIDAPLTAGSEIALERDKANYLFNVMRLGVGDTVLLFNGRDGEWRTEASAASKRGGVLRTLEQTRAQDAPPDIELIFAPIKKARTDFIVEKACELGCRRVRPIFTRYTNAERLRPDRLIAHMIEAAEQCGGLTVPDLAPAAKLGEVLAELGRPRARLLRRDSLRSAPRRRPARPAARHARLGPDRPRGRLRAGGSHANPRDPVRDPSQPRPPSTACRHGCRRSAGSVAVVARRLVTEAATHPIGRA